jgi:hypothetical protein
VIKMLLFCSDKAKLRHFLFLNYFNIKFFR